MRRHPIFAAAVSVLLTVIFVSCPRPNPQPPPRRSTAADLLLAQLGHAEWQVRSKAVRALGAVKEPRAVGPIAQILQQDPDVRVRMAAAVACGQMRHVDLVTPLKKALMDPAVAVQQAAIRALGSFKSRESVRVLVKVLATRNPKLTGTILHSLAAMPPKLMRGRVGALPQLIAALKSKHSARSDLARRLLAAVGGAAVRALIKSMVPASKEVDGTGLDPQCKSTVCQAIIFIGGRAVPTLLQMIKESHADIEGDSDPSRDPGQSERVNARGLAAIWALQALGAKAVPYLLPLIGLDSTLGETAREALNEVGVAAAPGLIKTLKIGKPKARKSAAVLLAKLGGGAAAIAALTAALKDPSSSVQQAAARSLANYPSAAARRALLSILDSGSVAMRLAVVDGLHRTGKSSATSLLIRALADREVGVAVAAAQGLGAPVHKLAASALIKALGGRPMSVRIAAAAALGSIRGPEAYKGLRKVALGRNAKMAEQALASLGSFKTKAAKALLKRLSRSRNKRIAVAAKAALKGDIGGLRPIGIPSCDTYMRAYVCYLGKLPASVQSVTKSVFKKTFDALRKMSKGPARAMMSKSCQMIFDAWKKVVIKQPTNKACFKP